MSTTYKIDRIRRKVRVSRYTFFPQHYVELTEEEAIAITEWVEERQLGRRVAWDQWQLNSNEAVTMFMIKYG